MPFDGATLAVVIRTLETCLIGGRVDKIAQPEADEILVTVRNCGQNHTLLLSASPNCARAHLTSTRKSNPLEPPMLCCLMRKRLLGGHICAVQQIDADRILSIAIEHADELGDPVTDSIVCEFMGKYSNIFLLDGNGRILEAARHVNDHMSRVREVLPGLPYEYPPAHGKLRFTDFSVEALSARLRTIGGGRLKRALAEAISGLSGNLAAELTFRACGDEEATYDTTATDSLAARIHTLFCDCLAHPHPAILFRADGTPADMTAFFNPAHIALRAQPFEDLSEALDEFYRARDRAERIHQKSATLRHALQTNLERCEKKLSLQEEALAGSARMEEYRICGEMLTASVHLAQKGMKTVRVPNYYDETGGWMDISLDEALSPNQNAQRYFKKYQKARNARSLAAEQKAKTLEELTYLEGQVANLSNCTEEAELNEIRLELEQLGYVRANRNRRQIKRLPPSQPMTFTAPDGCLVRVGKNNVQNESLTFSARPNEWWLHVKELPGSHVIIQSERPSESTIAFAAGLAAHFSKGSGEARMLVDITQRKYVKKPAGAKPGFVTYTHQRTLMAEPHVPTDPQTVV